jgi:lipoprotein-anchoring transpeptidase ErfK/SrfK
MKLIRVDPARQIVETFESGKRVFLFDCVTGDSEHPTPRGTFRVLRKAHPYRSHTYNVQMDYAMFFTNDGIALHQYHGLVPLSVLRTLKQGVSGWFGSHGCVRLDEENARAIYKWANVGTEVRVL